MENKEKWIIYNPTKLTVCNVYSGEVCQDDDGFHVMLKCDIGKVEILFRGLVPTYTYSVEGLRMDTWAPIQEKNNDKMYFRKWFIFKIEYSNYIQWALKESCGFYSERELSHYRIVTNYEIIDILSLGEPLFIFH